MSIDPVAPALSATPAFAAEPQSAVSWGAVLAGAASGLAATFVLVALAAGLGLKLASPWPGGRSDLSGFTPMLGAEMILIQVLSSALAGYLAGRMRTRWTHIHSHEAHFRDTAHGLFAWAVSMLAGAALAATLLTSVAAHAPDVVLTAPADPVEVRRVELRAENIAAQYSLFLGIGLLLGAFTASVAAAVGGARREEMHLVFWEEHARSSAAARF